MTAFRRHFKVDCFVETGTYLGETANWAAGEFPQVFSIEASPELHQQATEKFQDRENLHLLLGSSSLVLKRLVPKAPSKVIYWLDAHWSDGNTFGEQCECPLLDEIAAIGLRKHEAFILIDDARLFLAPPPPPHKPAHWPDIAAVCKALREKDDSRYIVVVEDVIVAVPAAAKDMMIEYCRKLTAAGSVAVAA